MTSPNPSLQQQIRTLLEKHYFRTNVPLIHEEAAAEIAALFNSSKEALQSAYQDGYNAGYERGHFPHRFKKKV